MDLILEGENLTEEQKKVFWDLIDIFDKQGLLPYVMLIGSWSEMIYDKYYIPDYIAHIRTRDVDFLYKSLYKPTGKKFDIFNTLKEKGFSCETNRLTGIKKFVMEDFFTIEFLIKVLGSGDKEHQEIPSLGIVGIGLRDINMLERYSLTLLCDKYTITVPEPEAYILQKLIINPKRLKPDKKEKDLQSIRRLLPYINKERMLEIYSELTMKQQKAINETCEANFIDL